MFSPDLSIVFLILSYEADVLAPTSHLLSELYLVNIQNKGIVYNLLSMKGLACVAMLWTPVSNLSRTGLCGCRVLVQSRKPV